jgi:hypothetical protein
MCTARCRLQTQKDEISFLNVIFGMLQRKTAFFSGDKVRAKTDVTAASAETSAPMFQAEENFDTLISTLQFQKEEMMKQKKSGKKPKEVAIAFSVPHVHRCRSCPLMAHDLRL